MAYKPGSTIVTLPSPGAGSFNLLLLPPASGHRVIEAIYVFNGHSGNMTTIFYLSVGDAGMKRVLHVVGGMLPDTSFQLRGPYIMEGGTDTTKRTNLWALPFAVNPAVWRFSIEYGDYPVEA